MELNPDGPSGQLAIDAYQYSVPLEDMVLPVTDPVFDLNLRAVDEELRTFLTEPQDGARGVAKAFFRVIAEIRTTQFSAPSAQLLRGVETARVFGTVPADKGHFGRPYYEHVLRGLRSTLPDYVADIVLGNGSTKSAPDGISSIVVVHV